MHGLGRIRSTEYSFKVNVNSRYVTLVVNRTIVKTNSNLKKIAVLIDLAGIVISFLYLKIRVAVLEPRNCGGAAYCSVDLRGLNYLPIATAIIVIFGIIGILLSIGAKSRKQTHAKLALTFSIATIILPVCLFLFKAAH